DGIRYKLVTGVQTCSLPIWVLSACHCQLCRSVCLKPGTRLQADAAAKLAVAGAEHPEGAAPVRPQGPPCRPPPDGGRRRRAPNQIGRASCRERGHISPGGQL